MSLEERCYSVLVVSAAEKLNIAFSEILAEAYCQPVRFVSSISVGERAWSEQSYDFVVINSPLPDGAGVRFAIDLGSSRGTVVLLCIRAEFYDDVRDKVSEHGVFTISKPFSRSTFR